MKVFALRCACYVRREPPRNKLRQRSDPVPGNMTLSSDAELSEPQTLNSKYKLSDVALSHSGKLLDPSYSRDKG